MRNLVFIFGLFLVVTGCSRRGCPRSGDVVSFEMPGISSKCIGRIVGSTYESPQGFLQQGSVYYLIDQVSCDGRPHANVKINMFYLD